MNCILIIFYSILDPNVLCFIEWSQNLTDRFVQNWNQVIKMYNVRIGSQFIGSSSSSVRFFPCQFSIFDFDDYNLVASEWTLLGDCDSCPYERVDTFNAKNRPWYVSICLYAIHSSIYLSFYLAIGLFHCCFIHPLLFYFSIVALFVHLGISIQYQVRNTQSFSLI